MTALETNKLRMMVLIRLLKHVELFPNVTKHYHFFLGIPRSHIKYRELVAWLARIHHIFRVNCLIFDRNGFQYRNNEENKKNAVKYIIERMEEISKIMIGGDFRYGVLA